MTTKKKTPVKTPHWHISVGFDLAALEMRIADYMGQEIMRQRIERARRITRARATLAAVVKTGIERSALDELVKLATRDPGVL